MRDRYRIRMNSNGRYRVQGRHGWFLWRDWRDGDKWSDPSWRPHGLSGTLFDSSELACAQLLEAQEYDAKKRRGAQWSTVATSK